MGKPNFAWTRRIRCYDADMISTGTRALVATICLAGAGPAAAPRDTQPAEAHPLKIGITTYTFFSRRGWDNTEPRAIANSGLITGLSYGADSAGFIYDPDTDTFTDATPPGSTFTITQGMNRFGRITGDGREPAIGRYGFVWQQGTITEGQRELRPFLVRLKIDVITTARGINDSGVVVGRTTNADGRSDGFVGSDARGYQRLVAPGGEMPGNSTFCQGINNFAQVSCQVSDSEGNPLGAFIGSPR